MTGATGDLTPDEIQRDFKPGEWRETSDATHHADVTRARAASAPAQRGETGDPAALRDESTQIRIETAQAIAGLGLSPTGRESTEPGTS